MGRFRTGALVGLVSSVLLGALDAMQMASEGNVKQLTVEDWNVSGSSSSRR